MAAGNEITSKIPYNDVTNNYYTKLSKISRGIWSAVVKLCSGNCCEQPVCKFQYLRDLYLLATKISDYSEIVSENLLR